MGTDATGQAGERRAEQRKPLHARVKVLVAGRVIEVRAYDISPLGIGVYAEVNPRLGVVVDIQTTLLIQNKQVEQIRVKAKVVRSVFASDGRGFKVGLTFLEMDEASKAAIHRYMK